MRSGPQPLLGATPHLSRMEYCEAAVERSCKPIGAIGPWVSTPL